MGTTAILTSLAVTFGVLLDQTEGLPGRLPQHSLAQLTGAVVVSERAECIGLDPEELDYTALCRIGDVDATPSFIVWGDSHAAAYVPAIGDLAADAHVAGLSATANGCVPFIGVSRVRFSAKHPCRAFNHRVFEVIACHPQVATVILVARWAAHADAGPDKYELGDTLLLKDASFSASKLVENHVVFRHRRAAV